MLFVNAGRRDGTIDVWYAALKVMPENHTVAYQMAILLLQAKRFSEVPPVLEKPIAAAPDKYDLQVLRIRALLRGGHKEDAVAQAKIVAAGTSDPLTLNDLAL